MGPHISPQDLPTKELAMRISRCSTSQVFPFQTRRTRSRLLVIAVGGALSIGWLSMHGAVRAVPQIIDLGTLPGGTASIAFRISGDGNHVVGEANTLVNSNNVGRAFRWSLPAGPMTALPAPIGDLAARARAVNANGTVIGGDSDGIPFRWTSSGGTVFFPLLPNGSYGWVMGMSADGSQLSGTADANNFLLTTAVRWSAAGVPTIQQPLFPNENTYGHGMSADGSVIVGASSTPVGLRATRWVNNGPAQNLGVLSGGTFSVANSVSSNNLAITGVSEVMTQQGITGHAFRWTFQNGMQDLGKPAGAFLSASAAINSNGSCIVGIWDPGGPNRAMIWTSATGPMDLIAYVNMHGGNTTGWYFENAMGVSDDGRSVTGVGFFNGQYRAYLVRNLPCPPAVVISPPDPTTLCYFPPGHRPPGNPPEAIFTMQTDGGEPLSHAWSVVFGDDGAPDQITLAITHPLVVDPMSGMRFTAEGFETTTLVVSDFQPPPGLPPGEPLRRVGIIGHVFNPCGGISTTAVTLTPMLCTAPEPCTPADIAQTDAAPGADGRVDNGDFLLFISSYFVHECADCGGTVPGGVVEPCNPADIAQADATPGPDGCVDNGDLSQFISSFFTALCPE
jgi:uncharacterized membrane protein